MISSRIKYVKEEIRVIYIKWFFCPHLAHVRVYTSYFGGGNYIYVWLEVPLLLSQSFCFRLYKATLFIIICQNVFTFYIAIYKKIIK